MAQIPTQQTTPQQPGIQPVVTSQPPTQPLAGQVQPIEEKSSIFKKWWFWVIVVLVLGGIGAALYFFLL